MGCRALGGVELVVVMVEVVVATAAAALADVLGPLELEVESAAIRASTDRLVAWWLSCRCQPLSELLSGSR